MSPSGRRDVDDRPAAGSLEQRDGAPGAQERPIRLDHDAAPQSAGSEGLDRARGARDPGVVDQDVETAEGSARSPRTWPRPHPRATSVGLPPSSGCASSVAASAAVSMSQVHTRAPWAEKRRRSPARYRRRPLSPAPVCRDSPRFLLRAALRDSRRESYTASRAWARSAIRSSGCSTPTERRIIAGVIPSSACRGRWNVGMGHGARMLGQALGAAEADREADQPELLEQAEGLRLAAVHLEGEGGARRLALTPIDRARPDGRLPGNRDGATLSTLGWSARKSAT